MPPTHPPILFLHVPRTAGTTVLSLIRRKYPDDRTFLVGDAVVAAVGDRWAKQDAFERWDAARQALRSMPRRSRDELLLIGGHMVFGWHKDLPGDARYVSLVRDPVERLWSQYEYARRLEGHPVAVTDPGLLEFARSTVWGDNLHVRLFSGVGAGRPVGGLEPSLLDLAKANVDERFLLVGQQDEFDAFLVELRRVLGWSLPVYERKNATSPRDELPAAVRDELAERSALDYELLDWLAGRRDEPDRAARVEASAIRLASSLATRAAAAGRRVKAAAAGRSV